MGDAAGGKNKRGTALIWWKCHNGRNQKFVFYYGVRPSKSSTSHVKLNQKAVVRILNGGNNVVDVPWRRFNYNQTMHIWTRNNTIAQIFRTVNAGHGSFKLLVNAKRHLALGSNFSRY